MTLHPKFAFGHSSNRQKVCAPCGRKLKALRRISESQSKIIAQHLNSEFFLEDERFPVSISDACRKDLVKISKGEKHSRKISRSIWNHLKKHTGQTHVHFCQWTAWIFQP